MSDFVSPKKHLGQHFLKDENIAKKIVSYLDENRNYTRIIEVGPGTGMLTKYLLLNKFLETYVVEIDKESIAFLQRKFPELADRIIAGDFLETNLSTISSSPFALIGNFPYNISSQILFKVLDYKNQIPEVIGMFQKEVAERIASKHGNKTYGILSVLLQAFYTIEYLFTVNESVFIPPPKVKSAVIRLTRNNTTGIDCDEKLFFKVVKAGFNQRRKTLRNALRSNPNLNIDNCDVELLNKRAEQLSVNDFILLTKTVNYQ